MTPQLQPVLTALAVTVTVLLWASSFVVIRTVGTDLSPGPLALGRVGVAALVLTPLVLLNRSALLPSRRLLVPVIAYGAMWFAGYNVALNLAERHIDAATAALVVNIAPLLIAVGAAVLLREGLKVNVLLGCLVGLLGVVTMSSAVRGAAGDDSTVLGIGLGVLAAGLYASAVLVQKAKLTGLDRMRVTWLGCLVGTVVLLPFAPRLVSELTTARTGAVLGMLYLGVFSTAVGFTTWAYALSRSSASKLSPVGYLVTVVAVLLSWLLLREVPEPVVLLGGIICLLGVVLTRWGGTRSSGFNARRRRIPMLVRASEQARGSGR